MTYKEFTFFSQSNDQLVSFYALFFVTYKFESYFTLIELFLIVIILLSCCWLLRGKR